VDVTKFIKTIEGAGFYKSQIVHKHTIPTRRAKYKELSKPLPKKLASVLKRTGIEKLYTHQVYAIEALREGADAVIVTSTASGKTLCYNVPVLERLLKEPESRALYLYPTKALAQDQLRVLNRYQGEGGLSFEAGTYDGDTPTSLRRKLRDEAKMLLTNPDMLHSGILPNHAKWGTFFSRLRFVVVDEIHTYRGIFGSHVANVMRRLQRVCDHYGSRPVFAASSATIANPGEHASRLLGREMKVVDKDGSPRGPKQFFFWGSWSDAAPTPRRRNSSRTSSWTTSRRSPSCALAS
jgi:DEAD/DEAH box helicase domain-containing protein